MSPRVAIKWNNILHVCIWFSVNMSQQYAAIYRIESKLMVTASAETVNSKSKQEKS